MRTHLLAVVLGLAGCAVSPPGQENDDVPQQEAPTAQPERSCSPLPKLRDGATRFEQRLYIDLIIGMYGVCATGGMR